MEHQYEIFMFWYVGFIYWLFLFASIILFVLAIKYESWRMVLSSLIVIVPNIVMLLLGEFEFIMYVTFVLPILQMVLLIKFFRKETRLHMKN